MNNTLSIKKILTQLDYKPNIHIFESVSSTNTVLKELAQQKAPEGTVVIARSQTMGKGQMGKRFYSPKGCGIYLSILLRPKMPANEALFLTTSCAVAVSRAIEDVSNRHAGIKWVNDIYINNKKVCGILTESALNAKTNYLDYAIVGTGINMYPPNHGYPDDIKHTATALFPDAATANRKNNSLIAQFLNYFFNFYYNPNRKSYVKEYIERSIIIGKDIRLVEHNQVTDALAVQIDNNCRLQIKTKNGEMRWLSAGDVSIRL